MTEHKKIASVEANVKKKTPKKRQLHFRGINFQLFTTIIFF